MKAKPSKGKTAAKGKSPKQASSKPAAPAKKAAAPAAAARPSPKPVKRTALSAASPAPGRASEGPPPKPAPDRRVDKARRAAWRKEMERYRLVLLEKQRELTDAYKTTKGESREQPGDGTEDYIDYAVSSYAKEFLLSLTELDRKQLIQVEDALRRIDRGEFGRCQQCGEPINPKRLEVQPWARHCVRCQELEEQGLLPSYTYAQGEGLEDDEEPRAGEDEDLEEEAEPEEEEDLEVEESIIIDEEE